MTQASRVYYCDTDSILVDRRDKFDTSKELGGLKHEGQIKDGYFHAPKTYRYLKDLPEGHHGPLQAIIKAKGISRILDENGDSHSPAYEDFSQLVEHKELHIEQFSRVRSLLKSGSVHPHDVKRQKTFRDVVRTKRCFPANDGRSRAWNVSELTAS
jgi:hypothetical protein